MLETSVLPPLRINNISSCKLSATGEGGKRERGKDGRERGSWVSRKGKMKGLIEDKNDGSKERSSGLGVGFSEERDSKDKTKRKGRNGMDGVREW